MRFRPANIRLINRRSNLPRLLLALSSGKSKNNDNDKNNPIDSAGLTGSLHIRSMRSTPVRPSANPVGLSNFPWLAPACERFSSIQPAKLPIAGFTSARHEEGTTHPTAGISTKYTHNEGFGLRTPFNISRRVESTFQFFSGLRTISPGVKVRLPLTSNSISSELRWPLYRYTIYLARVSLIVKLLRLTIAERIVRLSAKVIFPIFLALTPLRPCLEKSFFEDTRNTTSQPSAERIAFLTKASFLLGTQGIYWL